MLFDLVLGKLFRMYHGQEQYVDPVDHDRIQAKINKGFFVNAKEHRPWLERVSFTRLFLKTILSIIHMMKAHYDPSIIVLPFQDC